MTHVLVPTNRVVAVVVLVVLALCGCPPAASPGTDGGAGGGSSGGGSGGGADSGTLDDAGISTPVTTQVSAAQGGVVRSASGRTVLTIPAGALAQDTAITLGFSAKRGAALVEVSDFGPSGLQFLKPATLEIVADAALAPTDHKLVVAVETGSTFTAVVDSMYADGGATAPIAHFSSFSIIAAPTTGPNGCLLLGNGPCQLAGNCCTVVDPNLNVECRTPAHLCCMANGGACIGAADCCNSYVNVDVGTPPSAQCSAGICCSMPGAPCADGPNGTPCCSTACVAGSCAPP